MANCHLCSKGVRLSNTAPLSTTHVACVGLSLSLATIIFQAAT